MNEHLIGAPLYMCFDWDYIFPNLFLVNMKLILKVQSYVWYEAKSMSLVISNYVTTMSTLQSSLNLWLQGLCFSCGNR
jgi:hypothetical protein